MQVGTYPCWNHSMQWKSNYCELRSKQHWLAWLFQEWEYQMTGIVGLASARVVYTPSSLSILWWCASLLTLCLSSMNLIPHWRQTYRTHGQGADTQCNVVWNIFHTWYLRRFFVAESYCHYHSCLCISPHEFCYVFPRCGMGSGHVRLPNGSFIHVILHTHYPFPLLQLPTHSLFSITLSWEAIFWLSHFFLTLLLLNSNEKVIEGIISTVFLAPSDTSSN